MKSKNKNLIYSLVTLWSVISRKCKLQFIQLSFLILLGGLSEVMTLGAIIPFLAILINPQDSLNIPLVYWVVDFFNFDILNGNYAGLMIIFSLVIVVANIVRYLLAFITVKFIYSLGHELSSTIYKNVLYESYAIHINRNSSEIIGGLSKVENFLWLVLTTLNALSGGVLILFITTTLIFINPLLTILIILGLSISYILFSLIFKDKLKANSRVISRNKNLEVKAVQEGMGSIRDILLDNTQKVFLGDFIKLDKQMRNAQTSNEIISPAPRYLIEVICILFIVFFAYLSINQNVKGSSVIVTISVLAVGLQRLIPLGQQVYYGWTRYNGNKEVFYDVVGLISKYENEDNILNEDISFNNKIEFKKVSFRYQKNLPLIIENLTFKIKKGSKVGIIGSTGSGKSTVVDLLMGLLSPSEGIISIDGKVLEKKYITSWKKNIAHVPQDVFLLDSSFKENIAFGKHYDEIDIDRVKWASKKAQISDFIENSSKGFDTLLGENGVALSGGQKQRIAIARALYKKSSVLIFDEATSALDVQTEKSVVSSIELLDDNLTTITIAHRLTSVLNCDWVYQLKNGYIIDQGAPKDIIDLQ